MAEPQRRYGLVLHSGVQPDETIHEFIARGWRKAVKKALRYADPDRRGGVRLGLSCGLISLVEFV